MVLGCCAGIAMAGGPSSAQLVTVEVEGSVFSLTDDPGILDDSVALGGAMRGTVVYDAGAMDIFPADPAFGFFVVPIPPASLRVEVGSYVFEGLTPLRITVADDGSIGDEVSYRQESVVADFPGVPAASVDFVSVVIFDPSATAIASDALPATPPTAADWSAGQIDVTGCLDGAVSGSACATPQAIEIRALVTRVPEPSAWILAVTSGAALALVARRARRDPRSAVRRTRWPHR
jgi:hypothetical protein